MEKPLPFWNRRRYYQIAVASVLGAGALAVRLSGLSYDRPGWDDDDFWSKVWLGFEILLWVAALVLAFFALRPRANRPA